MHSVIFPTKSNAVGDNRNHIRQMRRLAAAGLRRTLMWGVGMVLLAPLWFFPVKRSIQSAQFARIHTLQAGSRELVAFVITPDNPVRWVEAGREFFHEGMMYDIHSRVQIGDTLQVLALPDPAEAFWYRVFFASGLQPAGAQHAVFFFLFYFFHPFPSAPAATPAPPVQPAVPYAFWAPGSFQAVVAPPPEQGG